MMNLFTRVVKEVEAMENFSKDASLFGLMVAELERHPSFSILNEDGSGVVATFRFDTETQMFYREMSGIDNMHYGSDGNFLISRLYFQTTSQLLANIQDILDDEPWTYRFMSMLNERLEHEKYNGIEINFGTNYDGTASITIVKGYDTIEKYYFSTFKRSNFENYGCEVYTNEYPQDTMLDASEGNPIEKRTLFSLFGAVSDAVNKVDQYLTR